MNANNQKMNQLFCMSAHMKICYKLRCSSGQILKENEEKSNLISTDTSVSPHRSVRVTFGLFSY